MARVRQHRVQETRTLHDILPSKSASSGREFARIVNPLLFHHGRRNRRTVVGEQLFETSTDLAQVGIADLQAVDAAIARIGHAEYVKQRRKECQTPQTNPAMVDFDELSDDLKEANLDNARTIPRKLKSIGYEVRRVFGGGRPKRLRLTQKEIRAMAKMEHARWNWQNILQGWLYRKGRNSDKNKTTPWLRPWAKLLARIKAYDVQSVSLIPRMLQEAGYEAYRLNGHE